MLLRSCLIFVLAVLVAGCATTSTPVSSKTPESSFREGEEFFARKNYEDAIAQWKKVKESYVSPELTTMAELKIADAQFENGNYIEAAASYEDFRKLHPSHERTDYCLYRQGLCYYNQITGIDTDQTPVNNASNIFETFLQQYPKSEYAQEVRNKLEICRLKQEQYEVYIGRFYLRTDKYQAAIHRLEGALKRFPRSPGNDETLFYLGQSYLLAGEKTKGREAFNRLFNDYRQSRYVEQAKVFLDKHY